MRPFRREGLLERSAPFILATVAGLVLLLTVGPRPDLQLLVTGIAFVLVLAALVYLVPWHRLPRWTDLLPPLTYLVLIVALRRGLTGLEALTIAPYFLVPVFWVALHGARHDLWIVIAAAAVIRFGPGVVNGFPPGDLGYGASAFVVMTIVCVVTRRVVRTAIEGERSLRSILDRLPVGFAVTRGGIVQYANERLCEDLGYAPTELEGRDVGEPAHDMHLPRSDGGEVILSAQSIPIVFEARSAVAVMLRDVSDERRLELAERANREATARERELLRAILDSVEDGVALLDRDRRGVLANEAYLRLFALEADRFVGITRDDFVAHVAKTTQAPAEIMQRFAELVEVDGTSRMTFEFLHPRRSVHRRTIKPVTISGAPGFLVVWHDVTDHTDLVAERERQAHADPLTGVVNRRGAVEALERDASRATRGESSLSVALFDVDRFKQINDQHGHQAGDEALRMVAGVLTGQARVIDTVARWGGDEFLVILPVGLEGARAYCQRALEALKVASAGAAAPITVSAGIAEHVITESTDGTLARADRALYAAKAAGRDRING